MNTIPNFDSGALQRFVGQLQLKTVSSTRVYRSVLDGFQRFVTQQSPNGVVSRQIIERWLHDRATVWPSHMVTHRARLVDRFLDWRVIDGSLTSNPLAQLRQDYGHSDTTSIVRALLARDPTAALEALRPPPRFASFLGSAMHDYIQLMQTIGHRYDTRAADFLRLDRFLQRRPDLAGRSLDVVIREWIGDAPTAQRACQCLGTGRILARALRRQDPSVPMPAMDPRVVQQARQAFRRPYIFTEEDVRRLLETARSLSSPRAPLRPLTVYTMLVLSYCAGLRVGELAQLTVGDIDLEEATIEVRETKFFKSRRLPVAPSVLAALRGYLEARQRAGAPTDVAAGLFWHQQPAGPYAYVTLHELLRHVIRHAGFKPQRGHVGPRGHDLRHSFVVNRMLTWYREGINPQSRLPYLATYLGHKDINSTLVYLTITQDLLQEASNRFHTFAVEALQDSIGDQP
jgi:integrase/recombinase XerD